MVNVSSMPEGIAVTSHVEGAGCLLVCHELICRS